MEISTSPAHQQIGADQIADAYAQYITDISRAVTARTITNYRHQIGPACEFWSVYTEAHDAVITRDVCADFVVYLRRDSGLGQNSIRTTVRRVRQFFKWLYTSGRLPIDISGWVELPAAHKAKIRILSREDLARLFGACTGAHRIRDMALIAFLVETGARRTEAAHLDYGNIQWTPTGSGCAFLEVTKGYKDADKRRTVVFGPKTGKLLQIMRVVYGRDLLAGSVFDLTNSGITHAMAGISRRAGVEFAPHDLRRTFATNWMKTCAAPSPALAERLLEVQLGHSPRTVTQAHYVALDHTDVARHYVSPLDALDLFGL